MKKFTKFYFHRFDFNKDALEAKFHYSFDNDVFFEEIIYFDSEKFLKRENLNFSVVNNILFHIHIALGISYYKAFPTNELIVESGYLDDNQIIFWKNFYTKGLGEYLFKNKINPYNLFNFINASNTFFNKINFKSSNNSLVALGGGKDSIVSMELLKKSNIPYDLFVFGKSDLLKENVAIKANKNILLIERRISDNLFKLNNEGYYNGHIPITGIIAFVVELVGYIYDYKYIVLSNEKSANFGNTIRKGIDINHQYSKSLEFEKDFDKYVNAYISNATKYFSILRGFYEIKVAGEFAILGKKYFNVFSSCNNNFKINSNGDEKGIWCNNCPKCLFVFTILRPFLNEDEVYQIFKEDLFERRDLEKLFKELLGTRGIKPFECVGEAEEMIYSMYKSISLYDKNYIPYNLELFRKELFVKLDEGVLKNIEKKFVSIDDEDIIPPEYKKLFLKNTQN